MYLLFQFKKGGFVKILSQIFILILLLLNLNSFSKGKLCAQNPHDLINEINKAYQQQKPLVFYNLMSRKSALKIEMQYKRYFRRWLFVMSKNKNKRLNAKDRASLVYMRNLLRLKGEDFYRLLFNVGLGLYAKEKPKSLGLILKSSKQLNGFTLISVSDAKKRQADFKLINEEGCLKLHLSRRQLSFFFYK